MTADKIKNHMMELKDDQVEIEEEDLIEEANWHEEEHGNAEKAFGTAKASNDEMYFENNTFLNRSLLARLHKRQHGRIKLQQNIIPNQRLKGIQLSNVKR